MKRIKDVVYAGIVKCLDSVTAPKFIGNLQGTADKAKGIEGLTTSVDELNHVKGVTNGVQTQINNLTKAINDAKALRASLEAYGMTKVTNSSAVTDSTGLALAATEKNASIDGTLANQISQLNSDLNKKVLKSYSLFFKNLVSAGTTKTFQSYDKRKISDYVLISISVIYLTNYCQSYTIDEYLWNTNLWIEFPVISSDNVFNISMQKVDDTHVCVKAPSETDIYFEITGIIHA